MQRARKREQSTEAEKTLTLAALDSMIDIAERDLRQHGAFGDDSSQCVKSELSICAQLRTRANVLVE